MAALCLILFDHVFFNKLCVNLSCLSAGVTIREIKDKAWQRRVNVWIPEIHFSTKIFPVKPFDGVFWGLIGYEIQTFYPSVWSLGGGHSPILSMVTVT